NPKDFKEKLGHQIVLQYHGQAAADKALEEWHKVHSERQVPEDMPDFKLAEPLSLAKVLVQAGLCASSGEAKRLAAEGGVRLDGEQQKDPNFVVTVKPGAPIVLQVGRRKFVRLV